jgi:hypothetical protein
VFLSFILTSIWIYGIIAADAAALSPACGSAGGLVIHPTGEQHGSDSIAPIHPAPYSPRNLDRG